MAESKDLRKKDDLEIVSDDPAVKAVIERLKHGEITETELEQFIQNLPNKKRAQVLATVVQHVQYQGPLPPPWMLQQFNDVVPGLAKQIISWTDKEQKHRHKMDGAVFLAQQGDVKRGQYIGASLLGILILGALWRLAVGDHVGAGLLLAGAVMTVIGKFIPSTNDNGNDSP